MKFTEAQLEDAIIQLLAKQGYSHMNRDEVYKEISEQAENFKKYNQ